VDTLAGVEPTEGHLQLVSDRHFGGIDVGEFTREPSAVCVVDDRGDHGRLQRVGEVIEGIGGHLAALIRETLPDAIQQTALMPVAPPAVDAQPPQPDAEFTYVAIVEVLPPIELGKLSGLAGKRPRVEVADADVDAELEKLRERNAPVVEEAQGTSAAEGHILTLDFVGRVGGEIFEGGTGKGVELEIGSGQFIPGFEEQLIGACAGDDRAVEVTFPDPYGSEALAGKDAVFDVHVAAIKRRQAPELDDEFAKDIGDFDTLDALRARRVYATSGPRIVLRVALDQYRMGSMIPAPDASGYSGNLFVQVLGAGPIERVDLIRSGSVVDSMPTEGLLEVTLQRPVDSLRSGEYLYVRAVQTDRAAAWSSPIYIE